jgi:hypothetical protein
VTDPEEDSKVIELVVMWRLSDNDMVTEPGCTINISYSYIEIESLES